VSRLPQLEQELVAAAARLQSPRRRLAPGARAALAGGAVALAVAAAGIVIAENRDRGEQGRETAGSAAFPPDAQLKDVMGVFRAPATAADRVSYPPEDPRLLTDRQPGEDPSRSRRVDWPGEEIYVWPMRDGVCYGVHSGSGCVPLDHLRRVGVSVGIQGGRPGQSVSGIVVDGIDKVVLTSPDGPDRTVPVRENFFFADLEGRSVEGVHWTYAGQERSFGVGSLLEPVAPPSPPVQSGAPNPHVDPLAESASPPLEFNVAGNAFRAVGFLTTRFAVCVKLTDVAAAVPGGVGCLAGRILREELAEKHAHLFASGGTLSRDIVHTGFARAEVVEITPRDPSSGVTVILSGPWRPEPWQGEPIRFVLAFDLASGRAEPGQIPRVSLNARLDDGRVIPIP
jgi:hypothetical protein